MGIALEIRNLSKRFGKAKALDRLNLSIEPGEFLVLLGPSGCGKTTLLRCIAGLEIPEEGEILIGNRVVFSSKRGIIVPPGKRGLGMVFQSYALWPHMNAFDNIAFGLRLQKLAAREIEERIREVLASLSMQELGQRYPSELSGGQQQRIALARLLATRPQVFLMDEPLSNLDARLRLDMRSELQRMHRQSGATTVYVTHDQMEAMTMASRLVVMKDGCSQQIAAPQKVYRQPANLFVAEFVGMPRINLLPARPVRQGKQCLLKVGDFQLPLEWAPPAREVIAAVRPEDITIHNKKSRKGIEFRVYALQPSGPELFIHLQRKDIQLIVRESVQLELRMDQAVWIDINPINLNLYSRQSGGLLLPEDEAHHDREGG